LIAPDAYNAMVTLDGFSFEVLRVETPEAESPLSRGMMLTLPALSSDAPVQSERILVGRAATAGLQLDHRSVSREHAWLTHHGGALWLHVASTKSATYVDEVRIHPGEEVPLKPGARVQFGAVLLGLRAQSETIPFRDVVTTDTPSALLEVTLDGPARVIRLGGTLLTLTPRAALFFAALAERPGEPVARWDLVDALDGAKGLPQLATEVRKAIQQRLRHATHDAETLRAAMLRGAPESQHNSIAAMAPEALATALIVARRGHGYCLSLSRDAVKIRG
jgi:pSer/pThr/pTyr-binding forkhead associated (FHA) protein